MLAAMTEPVLTRETLFLCPGSEHFGHLALLLDDHVAALGHAEGFLQQPEMIEFGSRRMFERLEPSRMYKIRHRNAVDFECILFHRVAHLISVLRAVGRFRPQVGDGVDDHLEELMTRSDAHKLPVLDRGLYEHFRDRLP